MANLTRVEAGTRSALIDVTGYRLELDLDQGTATFESSSTVRFRCAEPGASTFLDVKPQLLHKVLLNAACRSMLNRVKPARCTSFITSATYL